MTIMTKRGQQDNIVTYEHICDATADLQNIDPSYTTLGSVAIVLNGESGLEVYMANSSKEWMPLLTGGGGTSGAGSLSIYICTNEEVDNNGLPDVELPDENTIYLVASGADSGNLYEEYVYVNNAWEKFGAGSVNLEGYATQESVDALNEIIEPLKGAQFSCNTTGEGVSSTFSSNYFNYEAIDTKEVDNNTRYLVAHTFDVTDIEQNIYSGGILQFTFSENIDNFYLSYNPPLDTRIENIQKYEKYISLSFENEHLYLTYMYWANYSSLEDEYSAIKMFNDFTITCDITSLKFNAMIKSSLNTLGISADNINILTDDIDILYDRTDFIRNINFRIETVGEAVPAALNDTPDKFTYTAIETKQEDGETKYLLAHTFDINDINEYIMPDKIIQFIWEENIYNFLLPTNLALDTRYEDMEHGGHYISFSVDQQTSHLCLTFMYWNWMNSQNGYTGINVYDYENICTNTTDKFDAAVKKATENQNIAIPSTPSTNGTYVLKTEKTTNGETRKWVQDNQVFIVNAIDWPDSPGTRQLDKTYAEIKEAFLTGKKVILYSTSNHNTATEFNYSEIYLGENVDTQNNNFFYAVYPNNTNSVYYYTTDENETPKEYF